MSALERFYLSLEAEARMTWTGLLPVISEARAFTRHVSSSPAPPSARGRVVEKGCLTTDPPPLLDTPPVHVNLQSPQHLVVYTFDQMWSRG